MDEIRLDDLLKQKGVASSRRIPAFLRTRFVRLLERILCIPRINRFLLNHGSKRGIDLLDEIFEELEFSFLLGLREKERIPAEGPLVCVANHPLGGLDGLALLKIIKEVRSDVRIVANDVLMSIDSLSDLFLPVDTFSKQSLLSSMRSIDEALANQEAVILFPAGEVSRMTLGGVLDSKWHSGAMFLAKRHQAPILPVFVNGRNSVLFYFVSLFAKSLSTFLLPLEMFRRRRTPVTFHIGSCVPPKAFSSLDTKVATRLLRNQTYAIKSGQRRPFETEQHVIHPVDRQRLFKQLSNGYDMGSPTPGKRLFLVTMPQAPLVVREITRLRELTFRKVGEGTGRKSDADTYDEAYHHLVLWEERELEIIGAYRLGVCRSIIETLGEKGLYTNSLFAFTPMLRELLPQSIEMGRSFIQQRFWTSYALEYLWAGIGAIVDRNPQLRHLFGPVSISNSYSATAQEALVFFYRKWFEAKPRLAVSCNPYEIKPGPERELAGSFIGTTYKEDLNLLKMRLRMQGASIPILYRQYSELTDEGGATFSDFGVDQAFGDCIDGFVQVDLHRLTPLKRSRFIDQYRGALRAPELARNDKIPVEPLSNRE